ncbi:vWA domain-containing protein [Christiangramia sp. SM2212]|uniref:von Willebrand factor type A domain-containing protein n=1 Tax=Christiangramia sediminicola TaxID=3073267 RepID=A0ABU1ERL0_9FLAO|nr:von Willebrand factor type A domain-containing protein [Christiangramia sp. SM2212]MDR5591020.1 von Willebrand factor type A domain-containing protein [Christiangramia sp. SM2212]
MRLIYILFLTLSLNLQAKTITGKVIDTDNLSLPGVNVIIKGTSTGTTTDFDGKYSIEAKKGDILVFSFVGMKTKEVKVGEKTVLNVTMETDGSSLDEVVVTHGLAMASTGYAHGIRIRGVSSATVTENESYKEREENNFKLVKASPLSTFSIDVDKAGYSNIRRMINNGIDIPKDAVKIEEMINYFNYEYEQPTGKHPFSIQTEYAQTPWNKDTKLLKIGLQGKTIPLENVPASNLVFLLDVSGSMNSPNKLPLLKSAFKLLTSQLREQDKVSIVVYAGAAGTVLEPTSGDQKIKIDEALDKLSAGGSTAGGEGIQLAYKLAGDNFIKGGNNRVILATDGDFNVGLSSDSAMKDLIEEKRDSGIFLTALGFGMSNYKDSKLETLAQKGNGNHAYIDSMQEAQKVLGTEFGGTLYTIAKDVKIQVEFNPDNVQAFRLIGYENRLLNDEDFKDDKKDAGELGSGHSVTAVYEIIPAGVKSEFLKDIDDYKYTKHVPTANNSNELVTVKFRYKEPDGNKSKLLEEVVYTSAEKELSTDFNFISALSLFGMQLSESEFTNEKDVSMVLDLAEKGRGKDKEGYRAEFIRLVKSYQKPVDLAKE